MEPAGGHTEMCTSAMATVAQLGRGGSRKMVGEWAVSLGECRSRYIPEVSALATRCEPRLKSQRAHSLLEMTAVTQERRPSAGEEAGLTSFLAGEVGMS